MNESLKHLHALQDVDSQIAETKRALAALDDGAEARVRLTAAQEDLAAKDASLHEVERQIRDGELELKIIEAKIKNLEDKAYSGKVTNPKELSAMEQEIAMFGRNRSKLEDKLLPLYDLVEVRRSEAEAALKVVEEAAREAEEARSRFEEESAALQAKLKDFQPRRAKLAEVAEPGLLRRYETLRAKVGESAVVSVKDDRCGGCRMVLTPFELRELSDTSKIHTCETCGRFLYLEE